MLNGFSLSILIISIISSLGGILLHLYSFAIDYPLDVLSDAVNQRNWSGILSCIEIGVGSGVLLIASSTAAPYVVTFLKKKQRGPLKFATAYVSLFALTSIIITMYRVGETGILSDVVEMFGDGVCSRTTAGACQTVLYRTEYNITEKEDCKINAYSVSSINWNKADYPLIDWSDKEMYDVKNRNKTYMAYFKARTDSDDPLDITTADEMYLYHDCYYWGCDEICNDRYTINRIMVYASGIQSILNIALIILFACQIGRDEPEYSSVKPGPDPEPDPEPDLSDIVIADQGSSSDNNGTDSSLKSWNFNLRM